MRAIRTGVCFWIRRASERVSLLFVLSLVNAVILSGRKKVVLVGSAELVFKSVEAEYDLDEAVVSVEFDCVLDNMEQDVLEEVPVRVGPARNLIDFNHFNLDPFILKQVLEGLEKFKNQVGHGLLGLLEFDHEHFHVEFCQRHLAHDHVLHYLRRAPNGTRVLVVLFLLLCYRSQGNVPGLSLRGSCRWGFTVVLLAERAILKRVEEQACHVHDGVQRVELLVRKRSRQLLREVALHPLLFRAQDASDVGHEQQLLLRVVLELQSFDFDLDDF